MSRRDYLKYLGFKAQFLKQVLADSKTPTMIKLPKEIDERIAKEAVEESKKRNMRTASFRYGYEDGYYNGGIAEATRAMEREKVLVDALKDIAYQVNYSPGSSWQDIAEMMKIKAEEALTNYAGEKEVGNG